MEVVIFGWKNKYEKYLIDMLRNNKCNIGDVRTVK